MAETFTRFEAADYLTSEEGISAFLEAAAEGSDPSHMLNALATVAKARNMAQIARDAGISREGLYKALKAGGNPSFATVTKVAAALGVGVTFVPLPEAGASSYTPPPNASEEVSAGIEDEVVCARDGRVVARY